MDSEISIKSSAKSIDECFNHCLYEVPGFQRPYSWNDEQLQEFWIDIVERESDFLGSVVTWTTQNRRVFRSTYAIIDGQQRLTTCAILFSVLRDMFYKLSEDSSDAKFKEKSNKLGEKTQEYLVAEDKEGNFHKIVSRPEEMFYPHIQQRDAVPSSANWTASAQRIGCARKFFERKVIDKLKNEKNPHRRLDELKKIRYSLSKVQIIQIELNSEEDGFLVFETLNTRGMELRLADLVKNLIVKGGARQKVDRETIVSRWEGIVESVQGDSDRDDVVDRFIWQSWNSRREAVKMSELFKEISRYVSNTKHKCLSLLTELEMDAEIYAKLGNEDILVSPVSPKGKSRKDPFAVPGFVDSVRALAIFDVSAANSALLALARKYKEGKLNDKNLVRAAQSIESFHFQVTALKNSSSTGGTRSRYNKFAAELAAAKKTDEISSIITSLSVKLRNSLPNSDTAQDIFGSLFYAPKIKLNNSQVKKARKVFISYVLTTIYVRDGAIPAGTDPKTWTIEHIRPQESASDDANDLTYSIGNLTILTDKLNSTIGNGNLAVKRKAILKSHRFDPELQKWLEGSVDEVTDGMIKDRACALAGLAISDVWAIK